MKNQGLSSPTDGLSNMMINSPKSTADIDQSRQFGARESYSSKGQDILRETYTSIARPNQGSTRDSNEQPILSTGQLRAFQGSREDLVEMLDTVNEDDNLQDKHKVARGGNSQAVSMVNILQSNDFGAAKSDAHLFSDRNQIAPDPKNETAVKLANIDSMTDSTFEQPKGSQTVELKQGLGIQAGHRNVLSQDLNQNKLELGKIIVHDQAASGRGGAASKEDSETNQSQNRTAPATNQKNVLDQMIKKDQPRIEDTNKGQSLQLPSKAASGPDTSQSSNRGQIKLSDAFNELNFLQNLQKKLQSNVTKQLREKIAKDEQDKLAMMFQSSSGDKDGHRCSKLQSQKLQEKIFEKSTFAANYDTQNYLSLKIYLTVCYKQRNKFLVMKRLPQEIVEMQNFMDEYRRSTNYSQFRRFLRDQKERHGKRLQQILDVDLLQPWMDLQPDREAQNFVQCYGVIKVNNFYYQVSDLVQENVDLPAQRNMFHRFEQEMREILEMKELKLKQKSARRNSDDQEESDPEESLRGQQMTNAYQIIELFTKDDDVDPDDLNQNGKLHSRELQKKMCKELDIEFEGPAIDHFDTIVDKFIELYKDSQATIVKKLSPQERAIFEEEFRHRKDSMGIKHFMTYFGPRINEKHIQISKNIYQTIKAMELGNLSGHPKIPEVYIRCFLCFVLQVSRTLAYAHKNNVIHGQFDLSKVLIQQKRNDNKKDSSHTESCFNAFGKNNWKSSAHWNFDFNFIVINFEPFQVANFLMKAQEQESDFNRILKMQGMRPDESSVRKILKIKDLQAFGNSMVEFMIARHEEMEKEEYTFNSQSKKKKLSTHDAFSYIQGDVSKSQTKPNSSLAKNDSLEKLSQNKQQSEPPKSTTNFKVFRIPLDLIPLNWCKMPQTKYIFQILSLCFGPYDTNGSIDVDTATIFMKIHDLAHAAYLQSFTGGLSNTNCLNTHEAKLAQQLVSRNRLRSVVLNNQAVQLYLNLADFSSQSIRQTKMLKIEQLLEEACQISPSNQVALLNKTLFQWKQGNIRDDEFQYVNSTQILKLDAPLSRLMFILFKMHVQGDQVDEMEIQEIVRQLQKQDFIMSNAAKQIFKGPDFVDFQKASGPKKLEYRKHKAFLKSTYESKDMPKHNQRVDVPERFVVKDITFTDNELYVILIGEQQLKIIDSRVGQIVFSLNFPADERMQRFSASELDWILNKSVEKEKPMKYVEDPIVRAGTISFGQRRTKAGGMRSSDAFGQNQMNIENIFNDAQKLRLSQGSELMPQDHESLSTTPKEGAKSIFESIDKRQDQKVSIQTSTGPRQQEEVKQDAEAENDEAPAPQMVINDEDKEYVRNAARQRPNWRVVLANNGKQLGIYDVSQQSRNHFAKFDVNKQEFLFVYNITLAKTNIAPQSYVIDLFEMLGAEEVLNYQFNEIKGMPLQVVTVMLKNMKTYNIDYVQNQVLEEIQSQHMSVPNAHFFSKSHYSHNGQFYQKVKEFVQEQEGQGHWVRLPSLSENFIAVKEKDKLIVRLHDMRSLEVIRRIKLTLDDSFFEIEECDSDFEETVEPESRGTQMKAKEAIQQLQTALLLKTIDNNDTAKRKKENSRLSVRGMVAQVDENDQNKIKLFSISPKGSLLVSQIQNEIFIRITNQYSSFQGIASIDYQKSLHFLPVYQDEDYMFWYNKRKWANLQQSHITTDTSASINLSPMSLREPESLDCKNAKSLNRAIKTDPFFQIVNEENIEKYFVSFEKLNRFQGTQYAKNERMVELTQFLQLIISNPLKTFQIKCKNNQIRAQRVSQLLLMLRSFQRLDRANVEKQSINGLQPYVIWDKIEFSRSFEIIKDFQCSQNANKSLLACIINRQLHVYDFIFQKFLFKANLPNVTFPMNPTKKCLLFLDDDQVVMVRDGERRLILLSIAQQMEIFLKRTNIKKNDEVISLIDIPKKGNEIDIGFHKLDIQEEVGDGQYGQAGVMPNSPTGAQNDQDNAKREKGDESEEEQEESGGGKMYMEVDFDIQNIFQSRSPGEYSYVALLGEWRMHIYYVYEEESSGCGMTSHWDFNYQYDPQYKKYGRQMCLDFEEGCQGFVTGTNVGWVLIFDLLQKNLSEAIYIQNPVKPRIPESFDMIRDVAVERFFVCYSKKTQHLLYFENKSQEKKTAPIVKMYPYDPVTSGDVINLKIEITTKYMIATFQNGSIAFYDVMKQTLLKKIDPLPNCMLNSQNNISNIFVDDQCSLIAHLHNNEQRVDISLIDWQYHCIKLVKPKISVTHQKKPQSANEIREGLKEGLTQQLQDELARMQGSPLSKLKHQFDKSTTCEIF